MANEQHRPGENSAILNQIYDGMVVRDRDGQEIGRVVSVNMGTVDEDEPDRRNESSDTIDPVMPVATSVADQPQEDSPIGHPGQFLGSDEDLPQENKERLLRHGFIQIEGRNLTRQGRYVMPEQISAVADEIVHLELTREELQQG